MLPYFVYDQITFGPITFYTWGFFVGLAFVAGLWLILYQAKKKKLNYGVSASILTICVFLGSLIGARLGYILQFPKYYFSHPLEIFQINNGGLMFYGGLFGALLLGWLYLKKAKLDFWLMADLAAPAAALGIFIGRLGCSLINDHEGAVTSLPWGIIWPDGIIRHPVAEYLALNGLMMFLVLWNLRNRLKRPGQLFLIFLLFYGLSRFLLDFTRSADTLLADPHYLILTVSQWISLGTALIVFYKLSIHREQFFEVISKLISAAISSFKLRLRQTSQKDSRRSSTAP